MRGDKDGSEPALLRSTSHRRHQSTYTHNTTHMCSQNGHLQSSRVFKHSTIRPLGACTVANAGVTLIISHTHTHTHTYTHRYTYAPSKKMPCASCPTPNLVRLARIRVRLQHQKLHHVDAAICGSGPNWSTLILHGRSYSAITNSHAYAHT